MGDRRRYQLLKWLSMAAVVCCGAVAVVLGDQHQGTTTRIITTATREIDVACSSGDSTAAWDTAISRAAAGTDKTVHLFACKYRFDSMPLPITNGVEVVGQGLYSTFLERDYSPGARCAATTCEFIQVEDIGETVKDLAIFAAAGTSGGWGLHIISSDARRANFVSLDNVYISGYGTYTVPVFLDGTASLHDPKGIRAVHFTNVSVFNGTSRGFECWNCVDLNWQGGGVWQGFGTTEEVLVAGPLSAVNLITGFANGAVRYWSGSQLS